VHTTLRKERAIRAFLLAAVMVLAAPASSAGLDLEKLAAMQPRARTVIEVTFRKPLAGNDIPRL